MDTSWSTQENGKITQRQVITSKTLNYGDPSHRADGDVCVEQLKWSGADAGAFTLE